MAIHSRTRKASAFSTEHHPDVNHRSPGSTRCMMHQTSGRCQPLAGLKWLRVRFLQLLMIWKVDWHSSRTTAISINPGRLGRVYYRGGFADVCNGEYLGADPECFLILTEWMPNRNATQYAKSDPKANRLRLVSSLAASPSCSLLSVDNH